MKTIDEEAISKTLDGNPEAFSEIVIRHQMAVMRLCLFVCGEYDTASRLVKRTFLAFANNMVSYRYKGDVHDDMMNHACEEIDSWIKRGEQLISPIEGLENKLKGAFYIPAEEIERIQNATVEQVQAYSIRVAMALKKLPPQIKIVAGLKMFERRAYSDIADILDIPVAQVESRLEKFRAALMAK